MEKEIKEKILSELKELDCINDDYDALGITEQIMKIIKPLITENDSKRAQNCKHYVLNRCILRGCKCETRV